MSRLVLAPGAEARAIVKATGLMPGARHDRTFAAAPRLVGALDVPAEGPLDVPVVAELSVADLEPVGDFSAADRALILRNLRGDRVLDADRHPVLRFEGAYAGTRNAGELAGALTVRGVPHPLRFAVSARPDGPALAVDAWWQGTLGDLGIAPFSALLGAVRLKDWLRLELALRLVAGRGS